MADDINFLTNLANQGALSIANALAYQEIQLLNESLEQKVAERTQALAKANADLSISLKQREQAYQNLEQSQENLVRSEKMAVLGRLPASIAHEMNTPLGASLSSLKVMQELVDEYRTSISNTTVTAEDHCDIAQEMRQVVESTTQWTKKAATHIRSLKLHTRDLSSGQERNFSVLHVIEDCRLLLSHRLRLSQCTLTVDSQVVTPQLRGDPSKFGQVLTNLIVNAVDACRNEGKESGEIQITLAEAGGVDTDLVIHVQDQGCGIPEQDYEKIFEALYSTKPLGEGSGLGLAISQSIIINDFGGTIEVHSRPGRGTTFTLRVPKATEQHTQSDHPSMTRDLHPR